jgi:hypothetical protein
MNTLDFEEISLMGENLLTPREVAQNLQVPFAQVWEFLNDESSLFYKAFFSGVMTTKISHAEAVRLCQNTPDDNRMVAERILRFDEQIEIQLC